MNINIGINKKKDELKRKNEKDKITLLTMVYGGIL